MRLQTPFPQPGNTSKKSAPLNEQSCKFREWSGRPSQGEIRLHPRLDVVIGTSESSKGEKLIAMNSSLGALGYRGE